MSDTGARKKFKHPFDIAAEGMDWGQVAANGGPPCFHFESDNVRFCGRAQRWQGHTVWASEWPNHKFVSLRELLAVYAAGFGARQWISIENGLPEIGKEVLAGAFIEAAFTDGRKTSSWQCCLQRWLGDKWVDADTGEEDGATHWMPLPDPPEKNL